MGENITKLKRDILINKEVPKEHKDNNEAKRKGSNNVIQPNKGTNSNTNNAEVVSTPPASNKIPESYSIEVSQQALKCGQLKSVIFVNNIDNIDNREIKAHKQLLASTALKCGQLESAIFVSNMDNIDNGEIKAHKQLLAMPALKGGQLESTIFVNKYNLKEERDVTPEKSTKNNKQF